MSDQKLPNLDEESRRMHEELNAQVEPETPVSDAIKEAKSRVRASVNIDSVIKGVVKSARDFQDKIANLRELEEKDDCCLLSLQALMLGTKLVTFKFQCPNEVNLFAVRLEYCPKCGKKR